MTEPVAPRVLLGVAGGIAAYKACELLRRLTETGHAVRVLPTASALEFVGAATFEALSGQPVRTGVFADVPAVPHVKLGQEADLVVVAPATADLLSRAASGRADAPARYSAPSVCSRRPAWISRMAMDSGFSRGPGSTSGPTYSSRPSPSWE